MSLKLNSQWIQQRLRLQNSHRQQKHPRQCNHRQLDEHKVVEQPEEVKAFEQTGASETVHNPIIEETSIEADHRVEEKPFVPEVVTPALSSVEDRVTVFETQPKTDNQESTQLEGIPSVGTQADQVTEETHSTHDTLSGTEASAPITDSLSNEVSAQPVYVNHIMCMKMMWLSKR